MWYTKIVEAGALDVLSGDLEIKENDIETLQSLAKKVTNHETLPNFESIYKYLNSLLPKLESEKNQNVYGKPMYTNDRLDIQIKYAIGHLIKRYNHPDDISKANRLIPLLVAVNKILGSTPWIPELYEGVNLYFTYQTQNFIYNYGYKRLLSIAQEGVELPFSVRFSIVTNRDLESSRNLVDIESRKQLKELIIKNADFLQYMDGDIYTPQEIKINITKLSPKNRTEIFHSGALTIKDFENFLVTIADYHQESKNQDPSIEYFTDEGVRFPIVIGIEDVIEFTKILHKIKNKIDLNSYNYYMKWIWSIIKHGDLNIELIPVVKDDELKNIVEENLEFFKTILNPDTNLFLALGLGSKDEIIKYFIKMNFNTNFIREDAIPTAEEINQYQSKNIDEVSDDEIGDDLFDNCIANGSITFTSLEDPKYVKIFEDISNALGYTENEIDILNFLKQTPLVIFNTDEFFKKLTIKKPPILGSFQPGDAKPLGALSFPFRPDNNKSYNFGIFINSFKAQEAYEKDKIIAALNIDIEKINLSVIAHEVTHLLDVGIKGGASVFSRLDPTKSFKEGEVYNKSRLYLSDIREIVARVYGNSAFIAQVLHSEVENLRTNKDIREAAISELSDMLMKNPASHLNLTPMVDENTLQQWAEMKFGPYQQSQKPYTDATKTFLRQKEKARDFYLEAGKRQRRDILLKFLKELNSLKRQLESVQNNTDDSQVEIKKQLESDIENVNEKIKVAQQGGYDYDINLVIGAVANYVAFKGISITNEIASDPTFDPNTYITIPGEQKTQAIGDASPLTYQELREIRDFDLDRLSEGTEGGKQLKEQKPSFMSFDIYNPEWREDFRKTYNIQPENEKTSFNYSKWFKN